MNGGQSGHHSASGSSSGSSSGSTSTRNSSAASSSEEPAPPFRTLATYPGPGGAVQRQPPAPMLLPAPPVMGGIPVTTSHLPVAVAASQMVSRGPLPGSTTQNFINAMQAMTFNPKDESLHPAHKVNNIHPCSTLLISNPSTVRDQACKLQARIWGLRQGMHHQPEVPRDFLNSFDYDVQELISNTVKLNQSADALAAELKKVYGESERLQAIMGSQHVEHQQFRSKAEAAIHDLECDVQSQQERRLNVEAMLSSLEAQRTADIERIQGLENEVQKLEMFVQAPSDGPLQILQEQVDGKRTLWMNVHRDPQEQAAALERLRNTTVLNGATLSNRSMARGQTQAGSLHQSPQTKMVMRSQSRSAHPGQPHLRPPSRAGSSSVYSGASGLSHSRHAGSTPSRHSSMARPSPRVTKTTEWGSPNERRRDTACALVRVEPDDGESQKWAVEFQTLFALVYGFCKNYFEELPKIGKDWKSHLQGEAGGRLWDYICRVCHPGQEKERGDYALFLLKGSESRPYFIERLLIQHIILFVLSSEGWEDYSTDVDDEMRSLEQRLRATDPSKTFERQSIIDRRAELVTEMAEGPKAAAFKNHKLNQHHQQLRMMIAPFLPRTKENNMRDEAFYDLFAIAGAAWDLSSKLLRSRLTFQYVWNDPCAKFSADVHEALGCSIGPVYLQREHWRLKLCVTPAVTIRSDKGMTISARQILKSGVTVMR
ncbi:Liprin-beta-2 [Madurella mycetomatis]|uniref:Liprin-beta-2 n=1 Tax=Madurella mycetomatis TaxID=100816 RepID=A0A175WG98_9PEZI|nr:Liprin-beta-2 [Madurella mycetomatis]